MCAQVASLGAGRVNESGVSGRSVRLPAEGVGRLARARPTAGEHDQRERLATLGQLAGGVAHELRNPLALIKGAAEFLDSVLVDPSPDVEKALELIKSGAAKSERIVNGLLGCLRPAPILQPNVDVNGVVRTAVGEVPVPENVTVVLELERPVPGIRADPDHLMIVFGNIIANAIQAMPRGGRLTVKCRIAESEWLAVSFADTGIGIPEDQLDRLFAPLYTTKANGNGLGLSIAKMLIEAHGGNIQARSQAGGGSVFTVRLPIKACREMPQ